MNMWFMIFIEALVAGLIMGGLTFATQNRSQHTQITVRIFTLIFLVSVGLWLHQG